MDKSWQLSEEVIELMMSVQYNATIVKGLYRVIAYEEKTKYVLQS